MTEEELEWFENNWAHNKSVLNVTTFRREYKLHREPWHDWYDAPHEDTQYVNDRYCWKTKRDTQYLIPKVKKNKKRKSPEKEHWRQHQPYHSFKYKWAMELHRRWRRRKNKQENQ